ncbi:Crp/Fnr family transcriptional regulator [Sphingomonas sp.]|uniref:Crp/Fnr family transcriptional regulator n=1 Tax=Sphingomonas sp. TaxID=28214 RepID=UPI002FCA768C
MSEEHVFAPLVERWTQRFQLDDADCAAIRSLPHSERLLERDSYVVREGEASNNCCLLLSGFAYRHKLVRAGARQILSLHVSGEFVDLQNCLLGTADHNVQTLSRATVAFVPQAALLALAAARPAVGRAMWHDTMIDSSIFREWVVNVGRRDSVTRIAHLLCEIAVRLGAAGLAQDQSFILPLTQEQLADATGLTSVHTNRVLQALRRDGLISLSTRSLKVLDWHRLRELGDFNARYLHLETPRELSPA